MARVRSAAGTGVSAVRAAPRIWSLALIAAMLLFAIAGHANALSPQPDVHTIMFGSNSAHINAAGRKIINQIVSDVRKNYGDVYKIAATGHADRAGSADYNLALSLKRAEAVRDALVAAGIAASAITIDHRGETEPAVPTGDGVSERTNRRVTIVME